MLGGSGVELPGAVWMFSSSSESIRIRTSGVMDRKLYCHPARALRAAPYVAEYESFEDSESQLEQE